MSIAENPAASELLEGHVFVSYARKNQAFVDELVAALEAHGERAWLDRERIPDAMKWMQQIRFAIVDARACVFIISEQAVESEVWNIELNEAQSHGKRLVPVVIDNVQADRVPAALREIQWINFRGQSNFDESVRSLIETIAKNPEWVQAHTRFAIKAAEWNNGEGKKGALLRGIQLKEAAAWIEKPEARHKDPSLTNNQVAFIRASLIARKRRVVGMVIAMALGLVLAVVAIQQYQQADLRKQFVAAQIVADTADQAYGETGQALQVSTLLAVKSLTIADTKEGRRTIRRNLKLLPNVSFLLSRFDEEVLSLAFSPDGTRLLVGTENSGARLCDVEARTCEQALPVPGYVRHIKFSDKHEHVLTVGANAIIWDMQNLEAPLLNAGEGDTQAYAVSEDFKYLAVGDQYGYGEILNVKNGKKSFINADAGIFSLAFSQDGKLLASGSLAGTIQIWEVPSGKPFKCSRKQEQLLWSHGQRINTLMFVPRELLGYSLAAGSGFPTERQPDNMTRIWQLCDQNPAKEIQHENPIQSIVFSDDGKLLTSMDRHIAILSSYEPNLRGSPTQWNIGDINFQMDATLRDVAFVPDQHSVATGWAHGRSGTILISRPLEKANPLEPPIRVIRRFALDSAPQSFAFSKNARFLATGEKNGKVQIWPLKWGSNNTAKRTAVDLILEACRKLPPQVRQSIISSRHWQLPNSAQSDQDPCDSIE